MIRVKAKRPAIKFQRGMSLIETIISSSILLFILSTSFLVINTTIGTTSVIEKKMQLSQNLDSKIDRYLITGKFNHAYNQSNEFKQVKSSNPKIAKFEAKNKDFNIKITKEVLKV